MMRDALMARFQAHDALSVASMLPFDAMMIYACRLYDIWGFPRSMLSLRHHSSYTELLVPINCWIPTMRSKMLFPQQTSRSPAMLMAARFYIAADFQMAFGFALRRFLHSWPPRLLASGRLT